MADEPGGSAMPRRRRIAAVLFGDRLGLVVFLGTLACVAAWWRIGIFVTDSATVANTLANVADGRLEIVETPYSLSFGAQPGLHRVGTGSQPFGRNYGHALLAVPLVWLFEGLSAVTDPSLLLAGVWSLVVVALSVQVGALTGRRRIASLGSAVAFGLFLANVAAATPLSVGQFREGTSLPGVPAELLALQVTTMLAAAFVATTTYRLVERFHGRRVGAAAGLAVVVATPLGFWASIPKRHALTAAAVVAVLYCFAVSRDDRGRRGRWARVGAYAVVGVLTTLHPLEALFLFVVLVPLDLLTAPSNDRRTLGLVGGVFALSLVPFFVVNTLISGNPIKPPRMLADVGWRLDLSPDPGELTEAPEPDTAGGDAGTGGGGNDGSGDTGGGGGTPAGDEGGETGDGSGASGTGDGDGGSRSSGGSGDGGSSGTSGETGDGGGGLSFEFLLAPLLRGLGFVERVVGFALRTVIGGLGRLTDPDGLYHTFVRSGRIPGVDYALNDFEAVELALLEAFPLVAALVWLPARGLRRTREGIDRSQFGRPARQTDLLAAGLAVVFVVVYLPRLPLRSQITVRYLLPVAPIAVYGLARLAVVRRPVEAVPRWVAGSYVAATLGGGLAIVGALAVLDPALGEAVQFHALVGLGAAVVAAVAVLAWRRHDSDRLLAAALAVPAGATTVFLTLSSLTYFDYGQHALGLVREIAGAMPIL